MRVLVPRAPFIAGKLDLKAFLSAIPQPRVRVMQAALARHKRGFQYSVDDDPADATSVVLRRVAAEATRNGCPLN